MGVFLLSSRDAGRIDGARPGSVGASRLWRVLGRVGTGRPAKTANRTLHRSLWWPTCTRGDQPDVCRGPDGPRDRPEFAYVFWRMAVDRGRHGSRAIRSGVLYRGATVRRPGAQR